MKSNYHYKKTILMIFRHPLIFMLLIFPCITLPAYQSVKELAQAKKIILSDAEKLKLEKERKQEEDHKLLVATYDKLSDAIAINDLLTVEKLFKENPHLKNYAHHDEGTPLHFARSKEMAELLSEKLGFDANVCDEWGELPSKTILTTKDQFFPQPQEKPLIAQYFASRETRFSKMYYQLTNNKNIHRKVTLTVTAILLLTLDCYLLQVGLHPLPAL